jgi:hypothetical protein
MMIPRKSWRAFVESFLPERVYQWLERRRRAKRPVERPVTHGHMHVTPDKGKRR